MKYKPVHGKTYSLFGKSDTTENYYNLISKTADSLLKTCPDIDRLLGLIAEKNKKPSWIRKVLKLNTKPDIIDDRLHNFISDSLHEFSYNVKEHIKSLSVFRIFERSLFTAEYQYYLYMVSIELINRVNKHRFGAANYRIALLPHCLRDLTKDCKSVQDGYDYKCKGCSRDCFINAVSKLLKSFNIDPYIWKTIDLKNLFKELKIKHGNFGVLGMACIPELYAGMNRCMKYNIPVLGLPLDANRCIRWMGDFYDNSVNLARLEELVK